MSQRWLTTCMRLIIEQISRNTYRGIVCSIEVYSAARRTYRPRSANSLLIRLSAMIPWDEALKREGGRSRADDAVDAWTGCVNCG